MIKYFELLLDLLEIAEKDNYLKVAQIIESNKSKKIEVYHQYPFIFLWYHKLLNEELQVEEFLQLWDFQSKIKYDTTKPDSITFLKSNPDIDSETIYVFDSISQGIIDTAENIFYV